MNGILTIQNAPKFTGINLCLGILKDWNFKVAEFNPAPPKGMQMQSNISFRRTNLRDGNGQRGIQASLEHYIVSKHTPTDEVRYGAKHSITFPHFLLSELIPFMLFITYDVRHYREYVLFLEDTEAVDVIYEYFYDCWKGIVDERIK